MNEMIIRMRLDRIKIAVMAAKEEIRMFEDAMMRGNWIEARNMLAAAYADIQSAYKLLLSIIRERELAKKGER
jgi:hypothetical protein